MSVHVELRRGAYHDSVSLLQVSRAVAAAPGVEAAQVAMATELNVDVLRGMGFAVPEEAGPNDLLVALRATDDDGVACGLAAVEDALAALSATAGSTGADDEVPPGTLGSAVRRSGAGLALVSVPGAHAVTETYDAIAAGASVMLFSDNVSVADEVALKDAAAAADVLVMGPDCGTALVGGVALGFADVVRAGPVGIVAASGTGAQQVMCLLDAAGVGVSHCLGVGGRDLSAAVGGRSTRQALRALAADAATDWVLVVSKPPDPDVLAAMEREVEALGLRAHWATLGAGRPDLTAAVEQALAAEGVAVPDWPAVLAPSDAPPAAADAPTTPAGSLRGIFCGGTLAEEAALVAGAVLGPVSSNLGHDPEHALGSDLAAVGHTVIDFGADELTRGRAHPMIDPTLRMERIAAEAADPTCGVLLLDLVLGHGAHPDPGPELAEALRAARASARSAGRELPVVVSLCGTDADPQDRRRTEATLADAGASVFLSNAAAARHAAGILGGAR